MAYSQDIPNWGHQTWGVAPGYGMKGLRPKSLALSNVSCWLAPECLALPVY